MVLVSQLFLQVYDPDVHAVDIDLYTEWSLQIKSKAPGFWDVVAKSNDRQQLFENYPEDLLKQQVLQKSWMNDVFRTHAEAWVLYRRVFSKSLPGTWAGFVHVHDASLVFSCTRAFKLLHKAQDTLMGVYEKISARIDPPEGKKRRRLSIPEWRTLWRAAVRGLDDLDQGVHVLVSGGFCAPMSGIDDVRREYPPPPEVLDTSATDRDAEKDRVVKAVQNLKGRGYNKLLGDFVRAEVLPYVVREMEESVSQTRTLFQQLNDVYFDVEESGMPRNAMKEVAKKARKESV